MVRLIISIFFIFIVYGCSIMVGYSREPVLEIRTTGSLKMEIIHEDGVQYLKVNGGSIYSSIHGIKTVDQIAEDGVVVLIVKLATGNDTKLSFNEKIRLDYNIRSVVFGTERVEIWSKKHGLNKEVLQRFPDFSNIP